MVNVPDVITMNLENICKQTVFVAENAAEIIRSHINSADYKIDAKGKNDFVTEIDKKTEKFIVDELQRILPDAGFIAEEKSSLKVGEVFNWIVDPIDGTSNFIHGIYPCSVSIALKQNDEIVVGVVYEVGLKECFCAYKNGGAWLNGEKISVSKVNSVSNAFVATGFPYNRFEIINPYIDLLKYFVTNAQGVRRLGSAAVDMAYVAAGRFDAFYEYDLKPYDVAAGIIILQEAGGKVCDFSGGDNYLFGGEMVATNSLIHKEFSSVVTKFMNGCKG